MGLQICGPKPDSFYNGNVHYKMEGVVRSCNNNILHGTSTQEENATLVEYETLLLHVIRIPL